MQNVTKLFYSWAERMGSDAWQVAPMPEFASVVAELRAAIVAIDTPAALECVRANTLAALVSVTLETTVEEGIPYTGPYPAPYPYVPTLLALRDGVKFLDAAWRARGYPGMMPPYHSDRYQHYEMYVLMHARSTLLLPTTRVLSMRDLLDVRGLRVQYIGVATEPTFSDRFVNGPYDFWVHDMTHARRMMEHDRVADLDECAKNMQRMLARIDTSLRRTEYTTILFELLHEAALSPDNTEALRAYLVRPNGADEPFEYMETPTPLDARIMDDGNIDSGARYVGEVQTKLRIFWYTALNTTATLVNKLRHGFFDPVDAPDPSVWPVNLRSPDAIADAVVGFAADVLLMPLDDAEAREVCLSATTPKGLVQVFLYPEIKA